MLVFAYQTDEGLVVVHPAPKADLERIFGEMNEEQYIAHVLKYSIPEGIANVKQLTINDLPESRRFRNAWRLDEAGNVVHDMEKAKQIHLESLKFRREETLAKLDIKWSRAFAKGDFASAKEIEDRRQRLRDLPKDVFPHLDNCSNVDELVLVEHKDLE